MLIFGYDDCLVRVVLFHKPRAEVCSFFLFWQPVPRKRSHEFPYKGCKNRISPETIRTRSFPRRLFHNAWVNISGYFLKVMCPRTALERAFPKSRITESRIIILLLSRDPRISSEIIRTRSFLHRLFHNACVNIFGYF